MMEAVLSFGDLLRKEQRTYAARLLIDSMGLEMELTCLKAPGCEAEGLRVPGAPRVSCSELDEIFASATLLREMCCRLDCMGRLDEATLTWMVSKPWIDLLGIELGEKRLPGPGVHRRVETSFRVVISHDIDRTSGLEPAGLVKSLLHSLGLNLVWPQMSGALSQEIWLRNLDRLLDCERRHGIGAHYFMLSGPYGLRRYSSRYDIKWAQSRKMVSMILDAGMKIGLHGSYYARDHNSYAVERKRLEDAVCAPVVCHRNHYLRFDPLRIWGQLEAAGIEYDFSIGFNSRIGFRSACARAHRTFDLANNRPSRVISIPLLFMDGILFRDERPVVLHQLRQALEEVKRVNGCVSLLFHPELFLVDSRLFTVFEDILDICREQGADLSGRLPDRPDSTAVTG